MTTRHARSPLVAAVLTVGVVTLAASTARAQTTTLPDQGGIITVVGCVAHEEVKNHKSYVLVKTIVGSIPSVTEAACTSSPGDQVIKLQDRNKVDFDETFVGRWVEVTGRLEDSHRKVRELHMRSIKAVPVAQPRVAEVATPTPPPFTEPPPAAPAAEPAIESQPEPRPEPQPVATSGVKELPKTATSLPLFGLIGLVSLTGGLVLQLLNRRFERG